GAPVLSPSSSSSCLCHYLCLPCFSSTRFARPDICTLSLHDALPICSIISLPIGMLFIILFFVTDKIRPLDIGCVCLGVCSYLFRSEEHTSELQSRFELVCPLLLEKKKRQYTIL